MLSNYYYCINFKKYLDYMSKLKVSTEMEKVSKKQIQKEVLEKLTGSLSQYHLKDKKLENRLDKVSRLLAGDIVKVIKKEQEQQATEETAVVEMEATPRKKKHKKHKETVAAE